jgi:hypothetical protein
LSRVRILLYGTAVLALTMISSPDAIRSALAASASALFEATPFLFAGIVAARLLQRRHAVEYLGCGCGHGPSARSIPAAAATWFLFGPFVAIARYLGALAVASLLDRRRPHRVVGAHPLSELTALLPAALLAGAATECAAAFDPSRLPPLAAAALGGVLGFVAAPCGLGAVTLASALRVRAPIAAAAFLCIAGIVDFRALRGRSHAIPAQDAFGYLMLAAALGIVAWHRGNALVHPAFTLPLGCCACGALLCAIIARDRRSGSVRVAPALMLIAAVLGTPPPQYHATETTLSDLFPGERLSFTGALARDGGASALVRYAITCCRADAAPVAVRLDRSPRYPAGTWLHIEGRIESIGGDLRLVPQEVVPLTPPADPFIYR